MYSVVSRSTVDVPDRKRKLQCFEGILHAENVKGIEAEEQEEKLCNAVETVMQFTYLGDRVSAGGGCETTVSTRKRHG